MDVTELVQKTKKVLLIGWGAVGALLIIALVQAPQVWFDEHPAEPISIGGWYAVWIVLFIASLTQGFIVLFARHTQMMERQERIRLGFSFLLIFWVNLLALTLQLGVTGGAFYVLATIALGLVIGGAYLLARRKTEKSETLFP